MKNDVIKKSKQIAIPNNTQRKKVDKIANQVFSLVNKEAEKQKSVVGIHNFPELTPTDSVVIFTVAVVAPVVPDVVQLTAVAVFEEPEDDEVPPPPPPHE